MEKDLIFQTFKIQSNSEPGWKYDVDVFWGGEMRCNCVRGSMKQECRHQREVSASLTPFQKSMIKEHDNIAKKFRK